MNEKSKMETVPSPPTEIKLTDVNLREEAMWGAKNIARLARVSVDCVYEWAKLEGCPIYQPDGKRYFIIKSEFLRWLRRKKEQLPALASTSED